MTPIGADYVAYLLELLRLVADILGVKTTSEVMMPVRSTMLAPQVERECRRLPDGIGIVHFVRSHLSGSMRRKSVKPLELCRIYS